MRRLIVALFITFVLSQAIFFALKYFLTDVPYILVARLHVIFLQQFLMLFGSAFIWWNLSPAIDCVLGETSPQPSYKRRRTICLQDVLKALLILTLVLTHICSVFYYLWIGEEPNIIAVFSLTSVALYIHVIFFLLIFLFLQLIYRLILCIDSRHFSIFRPLVTKEVVNRLFAVALAFVFVFAGLWVTLLPPVVRRVEVAIENLPYAQDGLTIVLLSDLHIGPTVGRSKVQKMVDIVNPLKPDLIAISGDLADGFVHSLGEAAFPLSQLKSKYGTYFATGNHEYLHGNVNEWFVLLKKMGIMPLHNKNEKIAIDDSLICIAGVDDLFAEHSRLPGHAMDYKKALRGCDANDTTIMLIHQPNAVSIVLKDSEIAKHIHLILSGHTHAGQMYVFVPLVYFWNSYFHGLYYDKDMKTYIYVSAGVNYFGPPVKVFGGSEIIHITLLKYSYY